MKLFLSAALLITTLYAGNNCTTQTRFSTPDAASAALFEALKTNNRSQLIHMMGETSHKWLFSGDTVIDENNRALFVDQYTQHHLLKKDAENRYHLVIGQDEWPFAAPIIACKKEWSFDGHAGREEVLNRRIGENELNTIQTLLAIVDAQREYATGDMDGNGFNDYAQKFLSSPGKKDGLYWKSTDNTQSPLGELVAAAAVEGYTKTSSSYHGYHFKILKSQGKSDLNRPYSYIVNKKMIGGFAILAYPAKYGSSGIMSFMVNHHGLVYQKDLGKNSVQKASAIQSFTLDKSWTKAE